MPPFSTSPLPQWNALSIGPATIPLRTPGLARRHRREQPIEIAPGVWWVGVRLANDFSSATPMELADQALYAAKEDGRDRVRAADGLSLSSR